MFVKHYTLAGVSILALLGIAALSVPASATSIDPGFDLFQTPDGGAFIDFGPFTGGPIVDLTGEPIGPGNTDTIIERTSGLGDGETGTIQVEIVALSLTGSSSVEIGGSSYDIAVELDPLIQSLGWIEILTHDDTGGTFDSFFDVFVEVTLTEVGNAANVIVMAMQDQLASFGSTWSHTPPLGYPDDPNHPSGNFYPGPLHHTGPHPSVIPASDIPEPTTLLLVGLGMLGQGAAAYTKRRKAAKA